MRDGIRTLSIGALVALGGTMATPAHAGHDGHFTVAGARAPIDRMALIEVGDRYNPGVYQFNLYLASSEVRVGQYGPSGTGDAVLLKVYADGPELAAGTYRFERAVKPDAGRFNGGTVFRDYDFAEGGGEKFLVLGGTVDIAVSGGAYDVSLDLEVSPVTSNGTKALNGTYRGPVDSTHSL